MDPEHWKKYLLFNEGQVHFFVLQIIFTEKFFFDDVKLILMRLSVQFS
jgi:hypothetical protein